MTAAPALMTASFEPEKDAPYDQPQPEQTLDPKHIALAPFGGFYERYPGEDDEDKPKQ